MSGPRAPGPGRRRARARVTRRRLAWAAALLALTAIAAWRGPALADDLAPLGAGGWEPLLGAVACNLVSIGARALAWWVILGSAREGGRRPRGARVASAYGIGIVVNAVLPGRVGELARLAVISRAAGGGSERWAVLGGSILAHHVLDAIPLLAIASWVVVAGALPGDLTTAVVVSLAASGLALLAGILLARRGTVPERPSGTGRLLRMADRLREGLGILRAPRHLALALVLQSAGWAAELGAIALVFAAFDVEVPVVAVGAVLLATNAVTLFPFWPGNLGLFQALVALPLLAYGVAYPTGLVVALAIQAADLVAAIGVGVPALATEGWSLRTVRRSVDRIAPAPGHGSGQYWD